MEPLYKDTSLNRTLSSGPSVWIRGAPLYIFISGGPYIHVYKGRGVQTDIVLVTGVIKGLAIDACQVPKEEACIYIFSCFMYMRAYKN